MRRALLCSVAGIALSGGIGSALAQSAQSPTAVQTADAPDLLPTVSAQGQAAAAAPSTADAMALPTISVEGAGTNSYKPTSRRFPS